MKMQRLTLLLGIFLILCSLHLQGQNFRPFHPNRTHNFRCQYNFINEPDVIGRYGLRIESSIQAGAITIHRFNRIGAAKSTQSGPIYIDQDNIFGKEMIQRPGGVFEFVSSDQDTITIHTQLPLQTDWVFHKSSGITAQITSKLAHTVLGTHADSVLNISLSNGKTIVLSKSYGFLEVESFFPRHFGSHKISGKLYLEGIHQIGVGERLPGFDEIYDYYPGEKFYYLTTINGWDDCSKIYNRRTILSREDPNMSGGITFTIEEAKIRLDYYPGPPSGYVWDTTNLGRDTITETFTGRFFFSAYHLSNEVRGEQYLTGPFNIPGFGGLRKKYRIETFQYVDSLGKMVKYDMADIEEMGEGIGLYSHFYTGSDPGSHIGKELICYQKMTDSIGDCFSLEEIVSIDRGLPDVTIKAYPNPAHDYLWIKWEGQARPLEISLSDAYGKIVFSHKETGPNLKINTQSLPLGLYILKADFEGRIIHKEKILVVK